MEANDNSSESERKILNKAFYGSAGSVFWLLVGILFVRVVSNGVGDDLNPVFMMVNFVFLIFMFVSWFSGLIGIDRLLNLESGVKRTWRARASYVVQCVVPVVLAFLIFR